MSHTPEAIDPDIESEAVSTTALDLRRPDVPITLSDLAARKGEALEIIDARVQILETLRKAALRATSPEDWVLFKAPEEHGGQIVGYLQDAGCERVRDLSGIEIFNVGRMEKILTNDPKVFHYIISGSGRRKLTGQVVEHVEGGRSSTDDFCKDKSGADLELAVRKAARANLDGRIVRELAGLSTVPLEDMKDAWQGTNKKWENCRKGRGFGSRDERVGGASAKAPDVDPPVCPHCNTKGVYRPAKDNRKAFYGCPNYEKHKDKKFIVNAEQWVAEQQAKQPAAATAKPTTATNSVPPIQASELNFGVGSREPGQEG